MRVNAVIAIVLLFCSRSVDAWEHPERGKGTADHNYFFFVNQVDPNERLLLTHVENFHFYNCPHQPPGSQDSGPFADMRQGRYDRAIDDLDFILERMVNHPQALQLLCMAAKISNKLFVPISRFERALRLYPEYAVTHYQYGAYLLDIGDLEAALRALTRAIELDPSFAPAHAALSAAYARSGDADRAAAAAERARTLGFTGVIAGASPGD